MTTLTREQLRRLPKAELHCHLDGSVRASTLLELGREFGVPMPASSPEALAHHMWVRDARHLEDYLTRFDVTVSVMQSAPALERITWELLEDAHAEGVRYIEIRYCPLLNARGGLDLDEVVEAPRRAMERARATLGIRSGLIVCALRHLPPATSLDLARLAVAHAGRGVVGFDLAGGEAGNPATPHAAAFAYARDHGLACTCHAGEGAGAESVREAIHVCGARRVGHATHLADDERLMDECGERGVAIEACLTSNVQTHATASYASHPLRTYLARGLTVTLNTDNRLMSCTTLTDEYAHAVESLGLGVDEVLRVARAGFEAAFLPPAERATLLREADGALAAFRRELGTAA
ncbi:MAG TPA: adenosine deaminase [Gemmatimonadaceae bacterium]|nr:adenosine deaminase [Gemmatimonadaceae bacterium]